MTIIALTKSDVSPQGPTYASAHHVITNIVGNPSPGGKVRVTVESFTTKADYDAGKLGFCQRRFDFAMDYATPNDTKNLLDYLYGLLKTDTVQHGGFFATGTADVVI